MTAPDALEPDVRAFALFRALNERIVEIEGDRGEYDLVCECGDDTCTRVLRMSAREFDELRAEPDAFAVLSGHEHGAAVVGATEDYVVVRGRDSAG